MSVLDTIADLDEVTQAAFVGILACSAVFAVFALMAHAARGERVSTVVRHRYGWRAEIRGLIRQALRRVAVGLAVLVDLMSADLMTREVTR